MSRRVRASSLADRQREPAPRRQRPPARTAAAARASAGAAVRRGTSASTAEGSTSEERHAPGRGLAVAGVAVITLAFLVLGAELLRPRGIVPAEADVAADLTTLFSEVFGRAGYWLMVVGLVSAFATAVLTNQDGWRRLYTDGLRRLLDGTGLADRSWARPEVLSRAAVVVWLGLLPVALLAAVGDPVALLTLAGSIEAVHIPVVAGLTLWLNRRTLDPRVRPGPAATVLTVAAVLFFAGYAVAYLVQLVVS